MLLAVQTAGAHALRVQAPRQKILLAVRAGWRADVTVPSADGKREKGRDRTGHLSSRRCSGVRFTPRPHLTVQIHRQRFTALLDTGSEIFFVNTANAVRALGYKLRSGPGQIQLADSWYADIPGTITVPLAVQERTHQHAFSVLPTLDSATLIGVDLWVKLQITIPPPPSTRPESRPKRCSTTGGFAARTHEEDRQLREFLNCEITLFDKVRGPTPVTQHHIRLKNPAPIKQRYRPRNPAMQAVIDAEVAKMEEAGIIEPSRSAWSSPVVTVKKKDRPITAFTIPGRGLMQFRVMPFGLHSAPATFQRLLDTVLGPDLETHVFVYLDDIIVISRTFDRHLELLTEVFRRLREARLRLNPAKCKFCVDQLKYLGHVIDRKGIQTDRRRSAPLRTGPRRDRSNKSGNFSEWPFGTADL